MAPKRGIPDSVRREAEDLLATGLSREAIAEQLGISRSAAYKILPVRRARPEAIREVVDAMITLVGQGGEKTEDMVEALDTAAGALTRAGIEIGLDRARWARFEELLLELRDALGD